MVCSGLAPEGILSSSSVCHLQALPLLEIFTRFFLKGPFGQFEGPLPPVGIWRSREEASRCGGGSYRAAGGRESESALGLARRGAGACLAGAAAA